MSETVLDPGECEKRWGSRRKHKTKMNEQRPLVFCSSHASERDRLINKLLQRSITSFQHRCLPNAVKHQEGLAEV